MHEGASFVIDIAVAKSKISRGMTYDNVVSLVRHDPDLIKIESGGKLCSWSAVYHYGPLERLLGYQQENGHYWLDVLFDDQGAVEVSLTEA